jgi:aspartyl protease family protein
VAKVQLASVRLGGIEFRDVTALVGGRGQLSQTLLGMSFLSRLSSVRIDRGRLIMTR